MKKLTSKERQTLVNMDNNGGSIREADLLNSRVTMRKLVSAGLCNLSAKSGRYILTEAGRAALQSS
jgi:hypothetical protein